MNDIVLLRESLGAPASSVLVVVAHPDDETLGAGATIHRLSELGVEVHVAILSGEVTARYLRPDDDTLREDTLAALGELGVVSVEFGGFPNIEMNAVPHIRLVQFIESALERVTPTTVLTHHPGDINDDHRQVSSACQAAVRMPQRRPGFTPILGLLYMEVLSSTDWAFSDNLFQPTMFQQVEESDIAAKMAALTLYRQVMRPHPHPRSKASIEALTILRGSQSGVCYAEAFVTAFAIRKGRNQWA